MHGAQVEVAGIDHGRFGGVSDLGVVAHHLGAAGNHQIFHTRHNLRRSEIHSGNARTAEAIQRHARGAHVITGVERRHAAEIATLLAALRGGAPDNVVDLCGVEIVPLRQSGQYGRTQIRGVQVRQRALPDFSNATGGAARINNIGMTHCVSPDILGCGAHKRR